MSRSYTVTTSQTAKQGMLELYEEVNTLDEGGAVLDPSGALVFDINGNGKGEVVVYAPGTWILVKGGAKE